MKYLFLKYNNYFDRIIKSENTLDNYVDAVGVDEEDNPYKYAPSTDFNFNERDNLNTEIVFNWTKYWQPDYFILYEGAWKDNNIISRWFIIRQEKTRNGQYKFTLKRDIVADYKSNLNQFTANIDRCTLDATNPLIFNKENFQFNQVKQKEYQLFDNTGCPWVVGYLANNVSSKTIEIPTSTNNFDIDLSTINHDAWEYYSYTSGNVFNSNPDSLSVQFLLNGLKNSGGSTIISKKVNIVDGYIGNLSDYNSVYALLIGITTTGVIGSYYYWKGRHPEKYYEAMTNAISSYNKVKYNAIDISPVMAYNGKKIAFKDGVYSVSVKSSFNHTIEVGSNDPAKYSTDDICKDILKILLNAFSPAELGEKAAAYLKYTIGVYNISLVKVDVPAIKVVIPGTAKTLADAPYKLFCFPYPTDNALLENYQANWLQDYSKKLIQGIQSAYASTELYDLQLVPYCPIEFAGYSIDSGTYRYSHQPSWSENIDYVAVKNTSDNSTMGYIYFAPESSSKFTLEKIGVLKFSEIFKLGNKKIVNETTNYRFCAPNYSSAFDFSLAMNNGLTGVDVYLTYKPYNPYIQVTPIFGGLYGQSFDDSRGLILQGDYSLPKADSAWQTYELNNKTYQQSFNREIQSLKVQNDITNTNNIVKSITGTVSGAVSGAMVGSLAGGPIGAVAGGVLGGVASGVGGVADIVNTKKLQAEQLSAKTDQFNYSLQNIKAQPNTLTKTSAINATNKYVPFIEYYSATDEEIEILEEYITYNGMNAGYVGSINFSGYVQANILRANEVQINATELSVLNEELGKGVYLV